MYLRKLPVHKACWVKPEDTKSDEFKEFRRIKQKKYLAHDKYGQLVSCRFRFYHSNDPKQIPQCETVFHIRV
jgi:hypothetical protein